MKRSRVPVDNDLLEKAIQLTGICDKQELVTLALRRLIQKDNIYAAIRRLRGKYTWDGDIAAWRSARQSRR